MSQKFKIYYEQEKLFSNSQIAFSLENTKKIGEKKENKIFYSFYEAFYLLETKKAEILRNNKKMREEIVMKIFSKKERNFYEKYLVFKELRKKGYVVKTGLKFGTEFRVYKNKELEHAKWICYVIIKKRLDFDELVSRIRVAHSTGKKLLLTLVDSENDVSFYEIDWIKP